MPRSRNIGCSKIEYIKNIIIVVLLLTAVLLLYFFWRDTNLRKMGDQDELRKSYLESYYKPTIQEIVKPDEINIGFGESDYRKIGPQKFELIWAGSGEKDKNESIIAKLKAFGNKGDIIVNEINKSEYEKINNARVLNIVMPYSVTFSDFCDIYSLKKHAGYDIINRIKQISYSDLAKDSLFIYDEKGNKYYRLISNKKNVGFEKIINKFSKDKFYISYELGTIIGVENSVLIPLKMASPLEKFNVTQDIDFVNEYETSNLAKKFFGEGLEFIRKITQSDGKIIYMYDYSKQVLTIEQDGKVTYTEAGMVNNKKTNFIDSLKQAVDFISAHDGWKNFGGKEESLYLKNVEYDDEKNTYYFVFGVKVNSSKVFYDKEDPLKITVQGGKVIEYTKRMFKKEKEENKNTGDKRRVVYPGVDILTENYMEMYSELQKNYKASNGQPISFEEIISEVTGMETGYLIKISALKDRPITSANPVWKVSIGENKFFYDLYTGKKIMYTVEK